ncbi:MAG TPA: hypothetical protein VFQ30_13120, partial [Ktedonobacteraceae bacterium]|nr:hypothetical protein [Ktedonobacteraceae bacterium]
TPSHSYVSVALLNNASDHIITSSSLEEYSTYSSVRAFFPSQDGTFALYAVEEIRNILKYTDSQTGAFGFSLLRANN